MTETEANTQALTTNTEWIMISTIVVIIIFVGGFFINKYRTKNLIKRTMNKKGEIVQGEGENIIEDVDNTDGIIKQN